MKQVPRRGQALHSWLWFMQAVTGVGLALFALIHMLDVGTVIFGKEFYDKVAKFLEHGWISPVTVTVTWLVGIALILHAINGIRVASRPYLNAGTTWRHSRGLRHSGTWYWVFQVVSGSLIVAFAVIHWFWIHSFDGGVVEFAKSIGRVSNNWYVAFYVVFLATLIYHSANGVRAALIKIGLCSEKHQQQKLLRVVWGVGGALFALGIISLIMFRAHV